VFHSSEVSFTVVIPFNLWTLPNGLNQLPGAAITASLCTDKSHDTAKRNGLSFGSREFRKWINMNLESSVIIMIRLWAECLRNRSSILGGGYVFKAFRLPLWPTQPPIQWVLVAFSGGQCGLGVKLTTRLHLVPRLSVAILSTFSHAIMACIRINMRGQIQRLYHRFRSTHWNYLVARRWIPKNHSRKVLWVN
jgi:hypothetical protein